jgi:hypothetical protein
MEQTQFDTQTQTQIDDIFTSDAEKLIKAREFARSLTNCFEGMILWRGTYTPMDLETAREKSKEMAKFCASLIQIHDSNNTPYWEAVQSGIEKITLQEKLSSLFTTL